MRRMTRQDPAGVHFHTFWAARANDKQLALWLRLVALAYSSHRRNGHATFYLCGESTLPEVLGKPRKQVGQEIRRAVKHGFLGPESNLNCLVLPIGIEGGAEGNEYAECPYHPAHSVCRRETATSTDATKKQTRSAKRHTQCAADPF